MNYSQHRIASGLICLIAISVCWISYTQEPADAYLFPRLVASVFLVLSLVTFAKAILGRSKVGNGLSMIAFKNMLPGLIVSFIYIFWGAKALGFYTSSTIAFFVLFSLYDPTSNKDIKTWIKRVVITAGFVSVMYALFSVVLGVYAPRGMFI